MKKILFPILALFLTMSMVAQTVEYDEQPVVLNSKKNAFFLGPKIGGVITSMSQPNEGNLSDGSGFGLSAGMAMKMRFGRANENSVAGTGFWGLGLELKYKQNKVKTWAENSNGDYNANFAINYFEVPLYFHLYPFAKSRAMNSLYIELGASFAFSLGSNTDYLTLHNPSQEYSSVTYYFNSDKGKLKGNDIRPLVGLGYTIPNTGLDINVRYYIGTSGLAANFPCKMNSFEISIAWMFKTFKF